jgi:hypothetical protein
MRKAKGKGREVLQNRRYSIRREKRRYHSEKSRGRNRKRMRKEKGKGREVLQNRRNSIRREKRRYRSEKSRGIMGRE